MEIGILTAERYLERYGYATNPKNVLALRDEVESDYDRDEYDTLADLMDDAINNLISLNRLNK